MAESLPSTSMSSSADIQDCGSDSDSDELTPDSGSKPLVQSFLSQLRAPGRCARFVRTSVLLRVRKSLPAALTLAV